MYHPPLTDEQRASILEMHAEGATRRDIALAHGVSTGVVSKIVHAAGGTFPGNNGTRAGTLVRQLDLADWHDLRAVDLEAEALALDAAMITAAEAASSSAKMMAALTGPESRRADQYRRQAREHEEAAKRMRYAALLREMPDEDWPHVLVGIVQAASRGRLSKWEQEAVDTEFRRRRPGLDPFVLALIEAELATLKREQGLAVS